MKTKDKKTFDAVEMVREIRDAMYRQSVDPEFDKKEFDRIKRKWANLLRQQKQTKA